MEMVIRQANGKLTLGAGSAQQFVAELIDEGVATLDAGVEHMLRLGRLPPRHRDPFDSLLVAQALVEGLTLVSADPHVLAYDVTSIDARP
jgi:PIN domain nuclease of toxin-antitoxin system